MDPIKGQSSGDVLDPVSEEIDKKFSNSVDDNTNDAATAASLEKKSCVSGEDGTLKEMGHDLGSNEEPQEDPREVTGDELHNQQEISDTLRGIDQGTSYNSRNLDNERAPEAVVVIDSAQTGCGNHDRGKLEAKVNEPGLSKASMKAPKGMSKTDKNSCVIDIKHGSCKELSDNSDGERVCRICHLTSERPSDATAVSSTSDATSSDLIQLGCACKDELGIAHKHCAEAWFKLKGNRLCEICGETAKNVMGVADNGFMQEWNEIRFTDLNSTPPGRFRGCWRGQPFCNFLMACLVIAFVLPWFFRVNMF